MRIKQSGRNLMRRHCQQFSCASLTMYCKRYLWRKIIAALWRKF
ncbi:hypothetical protein Goari_025350, partial [Gossypium aridum]|nr:hypothetical protein [Gossypium aridum]